MRLLHRIFAATYDRTLAPVERAGLREWRAELLTGLSGTVVEIGAGTGLNLAHYPAAVERLVLTEPEQAMLERLRHRLDEVVEGIDAVAELASADALPLADGEADAVVCTLVLCTVAEPDSVLAEVRRVLRPGGTLVFLEHVAADHDPRRLRRQQRLDHVWPHVAGGCHLTRRSQEAIERAGFALVDVERASAQRAPTFIRTMVRGHAVSPA